MWANNPVEKICPGSWRRYARLEGSHHQLPGILHQIEISQRPALQTWCLDSWKQHPYCGNVQSYGWKFLLYSQNRVHLSTQAWISFLHMQKIWLTVSFISTILSVSISKQECLRFRFATPVSRIFLFRGSFCSVCTFWGYSFFVVFDARFFSNAVAKPLLFYLKSFSFAPPFFLHPLSRWLLFA